MPDSVGAADTPRVAVYLDFDNIVISRYDQVHGRNSFQKDKGRGLDKDKLTMVRLPDSSAPPKPAAGGDTALGPRTLPPAPPAATPPASEPNHAGAKPAKAAAPDTKG